MKKLCGFISIIIITTIFFSYKSKASSLVTYPIKFGVLLYRFDDAYINEVKEALTEIEKNNKDIVKFIFFDGDDNQELQNTQITEAIREGVDVIFLNLVDISRSQAVMDIIRPSNIPVIFFNREPTNMNWLKSYNKAYYVGTEACESGYIQAGMILEEIRRKELAADKINGFNTVIFQGESENIEAQLRSECAIRYLNTNNIKTNIIAHEYCNWERECARTKMDELLQTHGKSIDLIISNNDSMALGAIEALQQHGYNTGSNENYIPIVGVDGIEEAVTAIYSGFMTGTVIQSSEEMAKTLYRMGNNLVRGESILKDTGYRFDVTGIGIRIPYNGYIMRSS